MTAAEARQISTTPFEKAIFDTALKNIHESIKTLAARGANKLRIERPAETYPGLIAALQAQLTEEGYSLEEETLEHSKIKPGRKIWNITWA